MVSCSVEECGLAVGQLVGYDSVKSASQMNSAVVIVLDSVKKVNQVVQIGVVIQGSFTPVLSLVSPARRIIISNVPLFIRSEVVEKEPARHSQLLSPIKLIQSCKFPHLKHVVSFRRQVLMILKSPEELNLALAFRVDSFDYTVHVTSENMKCFRCRISFECAQSETLQLAVRRHQLAGADRVLWIPWWRTRRVLTVRSHRHETRGAQQTA